MPADLFLFCIELSSVSTDSSDWSVLMLVGNRACVSTVCLPSVVETYKWRSVLADENVARSVSTFEDLFSCLAFVNRTRSHVILFQAILSIYTSSCDSIESICLKIHALSAEVPKNR